MDRRFGLLLGTHMNFMEQAVALAGITAFTGSDHIVPGMLAAPRARNDVVDGQAFGAAAVLAGVVVATQHFATADGRHLPMAFGVAVEQANVLRHL